jgi:N-acetylmuramoyl-L-alanine amidase
LVECGFLTHSDEARCLKSSDYQQKLTQGIADGIRYVLASVDAIDFQPIPVELA